MYGIYAAEVQFHQEVAQREREQRNLVLRAERQLPEPPLPRRLPTAPRREAIRAAWPRPIAVRAAGGSAGTLAAYAKCC